MKNLIRNKWLPFEEAHKIVLKEAKKWGIDNQKKWNEYCTSGKKPNNIPRSVYSVYRGEGWVSMGHWLVTGNVRGAQRKYDVNHNFFKEWSSDMAYILGFWFADGCICHQYASGYRFRICQLKAGKIRQIGGRMRGAKNLSSKIKEENNGI